MEDSSVYSWETIYIIALIGNLKQNEVKKNLLSYVYYVAFHISKPQVPILQSNLELCQNIVTIKFFK